jgi:tight adherence protein C
MWLTSFLIFAAIFLACFALISVFFSLDKAKLVDDLGKRKSRLSQFRHELFSRLAHINAALPLPKYRKYIGERIQRSALEEKYTFETFLAMQESWAIVCAFMLWTIFPDSVLIVFIGVLIGFYVPLARLDAEGKRRLKRIRADLPYMMDLMTLSVQAGADFIFAIQNIIDNFPDRPLRDEMKMLLANVRAGNSRKEALLKLKLRVPLIEVSSFVGALIRADEMGSGLVEVLRAQSVFCKNKRMQELRERAKRAATLMIVPLILFIFPCMFIMILGPIAIKLVQTLATGG